MKVASGINRFDIYMMFADAIAKTGNLQRRLAATFMLYCNGMAWACFRFLLGHTSASRWDGCPLPANEIRADHLTVNRQPVAGKIRQSTTDEIGIDKKDILIVNRQSVTAEIQVIRQ